MLEYLFSKEKVVWEQAKDSVATASPIIDCHLNALAHELLVVAKAHCYVLHIEYDEGWASHGADWRHMPTLRLGFTLVSQANLRSILRLSARIHPKMLVASTAPIFIVFSSLRLTPSWLTYFGLIFASTILIRIRAMIAA